MGEDFLARFVSYPLDGSQKDNVNFVRNAFLVVVADLDVLLPNGREKSIVMTKLEEASFFAVAAIARREDGG